MTNPIALSATFLQNATQAQMPVTSTRNLRGAVIDSRAVTPECLFCALSGNHTDGIRFCKDALSRGAAGILVSHMPNDLPHDLSYSVFVVDDVRISLGKLASAVRLSVLPKVIAITGSVGKTTTKELIAHVLSTTYETHKNQGNLNNDLGLPLTVLSMPEHCAVLVTEAGMSHAKELAYLSNLVRPDIAVITNIGTAHIGNLGSREAIAEAKLEILQGLKPNGIALYDGDEPLLQTISGGLPVGFSERCAYRILGVHYTTDPTPCTEFLLQTPTAVIENLRVCGIGTHFAQDAAFAFAIGELLSVPEETIRMALFSALQTPLRGRQNRMIQNGICIIDDGYNASPESMCAALASLQMEPIQKGARKICVLGSMLELGELSPLLHRQVGQKATFCDFLITYGTQAEAIADGAREAGMPSANIRSFSEADTTDALVHLCQTLLRPGDILLCKGSHAMGLSEFTAQLQNVL